MTSDQVNGIARVLADPRRFGILRQIAETGTLACSALDVQQCLSPATISHHLKELQEAGLIHVEREGRVMRMNLNREIWNAYVRELSTL